MGRLEGRVRALEDRDGLSDAYKYPCHRIIQREGQSQDEAIDAYGRERVGARDRLIFRQIISPKFDAAGRIITQPSPRRKGRW